jgi:hypothetical protein
MQGRDSRVLGSRALVDGYAAGLGSYDDGAKGSKRFGSQWSDR